MTKAAQEIFRGLETNPIAPETDFGKFVVGDHLERAYNILRKSIEEMVAGNAPSRLQLVLGENGNGKTLLANKIAFYLSEKNVAKVGDSQGPASLKFDVLYSNISALGQASSQTILDIATNLRRSLIEAPEYTYSLIATKIAKDFDKDYKPPKYWSLVKILGRWATRWASLGLSDEWKQLEDALKNESTEAVKSALDATSKRIQKRLNEKHYRAALTKFLGDLELDSFVNVYFNQRSNLGIAQLRKAFLDDMKRNPTLEQPKMVVDQLGRIGKKVGCRIIVIIIDDCNQKAFVNQLLPLIGTLETFKEPRVFLIVNMLKSVAEKVRTIEGDKSSSQRLFYNAAIELPGPTEAEIRALYENLRKLFNDAFPSGESFVSDLPELADSAFAEWSQGIRKPLKDGGIDPNYRSAIKLLTAYLRRMALGTQVPTTKARNSRWAATAQAADGSDRSPATRRRSA